MLRELRREISSLNFLSMTQETEMELYLANFEAHMHARLQNPKGVVVAELETTFQ